MAKWRSPVNILTKSRQLSLSFSFVALSPFPLLFPMPFASYGLGSQEFHCVGVGPGKLPGRHDVNAVMMGYGSPPLPKLGHSLWKCGAPHIQHGPPSRFPRQLHFCFLVTRCFCGSVLLINLLRDSCFYFSAKPQMLHCLPPTISPLARTRCHPRGASLCHPRNCCCCGC